MKPTPKPDGANPLVLTFYGDQRPLNVLTIALLLGAPFWMASLIMRGLGGLIPLFLIMLALVVAWAIIDKPAFQYDINTQGFIASDEQFIPLMDIDRIELDGRDLYFIPRRRHQKGLHLKTRAWVVLPYKQILKEAEIHKWPIRDVTTPLGRILVWFMP